MRPVRAAALLGLCLFPLPACLAACGERAPPAAHATESVRAVLPDTAFSRLFRELSEPGGYFDTDNLISNETSYLHVLGTLRQRATRGGAYIGVGPDQSFSYMAAVRPEVAFIIDIRRDNALQHLLFKALFALAPTRVEYLSLLVGAPAPEDPAAWWDRSIDDIVARLDGVPRDAVAAGRARARVDSAVVTYGVPLSEEDLATIGRFHGEFIRRGLDLRFTSFGRSPQPYYPTLRQLVLETDLDGRRGSFLARRKDYVFLRGMQVTNRVVPVVGDLAGPHALRAVGEEIRRRGLTVSAFYTSNVEFYVYRAGTFQTFASNVASLPIDESSLLIRSYFPSARGIHPFAVRGYRSTQLLQTLESLRERASGAGYGSYWDLVTLDVLDPRVSAGGEGGGGAP